MALRKNRTNTISLMPQRQWMGRIGLLLLAVMGVSLMTMSRSGNASVQGLKGGLSDIMASVLYVAQSPVRAVSDAGTWVKEMVRIREENVALKNQNLQLLQYQSQVGELESEIKSLRGLLSVVPAKKTSFITARIVSDLGGPYARSALINGGAENGIHKDQAAINDQGLIGRITSVGESSAHVLLLSDINSRVPVLIEGAQEKSILIGRNQELPVLSYLAADTKVEVGQRVITSGDGGVFPRGIPVGVITSIEKNQVSIQPFADPANVEYVNVVDYNF